MSHFGLSGAWEVADPSVSIRPKADIKDFGGNPNSMTERNQASVRGSAIGWIIALMLLFLPGMVQFAAFGPHLWGFALFLGTLLALPFAYLGFRNATERRTWLVTVGLLAAFGATPIAIAAIIPESPGILGPELLLGFVMLASPFIAIAGARFTMRSKKRPTG